MIKHISLREVLQCKVIVDELRPYYPFQEFPISLLLSAMEGKLNELVNAVNDLQDNRT